MALTASTLLARGARALVLTLAGVAAAGCGARTGLQLDAPPSDAGVAMDAGPPPAPPPDAGAPPPRDSEPAPPDARDASLPRCSSDEECDDGVACTRDRCDAASGRCERAPDARACDDSAWCTGDERCDPTVGCVSPGRPCDDAVSCTVDRCDEALRACVREPDPALCPISHRCDPVTGCIARAIAHWDASVFDVDLPDGIVHPTFTADVMLTDIALHPDRTLYGVDLAALWRVDERTGRATLVTPLADPMSAEFNGLDAAPDGRLYASGGRRIVEIDPTTGRTRDVATFPGALRSSGDLAFLEGRLLATGYVVYRGFDTLVEADLGTGTARVVGATGFRCIWGLAAFGPTLYGLTCEGNVLAIDGDTGAATLLATDPTHEFWGSTAR